MMTPQTDNPSRRIDYGSPRTDRTTIWLLLLVVAALVIALTFSDAHGATLLTGI